MIYLGEHEEGVQVCIDGKWVLSRPENYKYRSLMTKIKDAFGVFVGKYEAVKFYKQ